MANSPEKRGDPDDYIPLTEEELHDMLHGPRGEPILDIVAEFECDLTGDLPRSKEAASDSP